MKPYLSYVIETALSLGIFTVVYLLFLRKETRFNANRFYLMGALLFSTFLPFISIKTNFVDISAISVTATDNSFQGTNLLETITVYASGIPAKVSSAILSFNFSVLIYFLGAAAALFLITTGIYQLFRIVTANRKFKLKGAKLIISKKETAPYSFFNFIFIGRDLIAQENWKSVVQHEIEHMRQGHSFDILFIDCMMVFQWFNPFYWIIRRLVRENHEFIADNGVIKKGNITPSGYMSLLLTQAIGGHPVITSNFFNVKTIKKRFKMITNNKKGKQSFLRYVVGVIAALSVSICFAIDNDAIITEANSKTVLSSENENLVFDNLIAENNEIDEDKAEFPGGEEALMKFIAKNTKYPFEAISKKIQGKVFVRFNINKEGKVEFPSVIRGVDPFLDEEALRVIKSMPAWNIGNNYGKDVSIAYTIPVSFVIDNKDKVVARLNDKVDETYVLCENMPEYPGGVDALKKFIAENVKYPVEAAKNKIQGKVYVTFDVDENGNVTDARIARGVAPSLDEEALRVVNLSPVWMPGTNKGKPVKVSYTVPINFLLQ
ncbi:MAG: M56 family metallopeptidase [Prolixibacteraceae bacterium]|nr:M56 family metallopeptidase [Prolixibacteraceae bacterium]